MYQYEAVVLKVIDGDTYILEVDLGFNIKVKEKFRLLDIDVYETSRRKSAFITDEEIVLGKKIKDSITKKLLNRRVTIKMYKNKLKDKYGRYLTEIFYMKDGKMVHLNDEIVKNGWAKK